MDRKIKSLFSLCQKAGKLVTGESNCENALKKNEAELIIVCTEASDNTKNKFINKCFYYKKKCIIFGERDEINAAIGKINRTSFAVLDKNFADKILNLIDEPIDFGQNKIRKMPDS